MESDMRPLICLCFLIAILLTGSRAQAAVITLSASLRSTPPGLSQGLGSATATVDDITGAFVVSGKFGTFEPAVGASLHGPNNPPFDFLGPEVLPLTISSSSPLGNQGTIGGGGVLDALQLSQLIAGKYLVVVESASVPGPTASISGSLTVPEPATGLMLVIALICGSQRACQPK